MSADKPCDALSCPQASHQLGTGICCSLPAILVPGMAQTVKRRRKCNAYFLIERDACEAQPALLSSAPKGVWAFPLWCVKFICYL
ncbi:Arylacetamide deacetylase-like 2 [Fusarium oxysporum f. sp. albedinis]|nr:Arylacetamide deacetylase-like 2 [Fusarium oxysporum f. sp. albedinis]